MNNGINKIRNNDNLQQTNYNWTITY